MSEFYVILERSASQTVAVAIEADTEEAAVALAEARADAHHLVLEDGKLGEFKVLEERCEPDDESSWEVVDWGLAVTPEVTIE